MISIQSNENVYQIINQCQINKSMVLFTPSPINQKHSKRHSINKNNCDNQMNRPTTIKNNDPIFIQVCTEHTN